MPNIMLEKGLSCKGCHIFHEEKGRLIKSETATSKAEACESCHGKGFARIQENWARATARKLGDVKAIYERAAREVGGSGGGKAAEARSLLEEAIYNIDLVERGKSVHNINYSQELLYVSWTKIEEALSLIGSPFKPPKPAAPAQPSAGLCSNCHSGIEELSGKVFGLTFPHKHHLAEQKLDCSTCHSNARKHGELVATRTTCAGCHHQEAKRECGSCHSLQKTLHEGGTLEGVAVPKDIMAEAEIGCRACHLDGDKKVFRPGADKCVECHEAEYRTTLKEWQDTTKNLLRELAASLKKAGQTAPAEDRKSEARRMESVLESITDDGSLGVHNYLFIEEFLTKSLKTIKSMPESGRN
jgi:hypothetical protein